MRKREKERSRRDIFLSRSQQNGRSNGKKKNKGKKKRITNDIVRAEALSVGGEVSEVARELYLVPTARRARRVKRSAAQEETSPMCHENREPCAETLREDETNRENETKPCREMQ